MALRTITVVLKLCSQSSELRIASCLFMYFRYFFSYISVYLCSPRNAALKSYQYVIPGTLQEPMPNIRHDNKPPPLRGKIGYNEPQALVPKIGDSSLLSRARTAVPPPPSPSYVQTSKLVFSQQRRKCKRRAMRLWKPFSFYLWVSWRISALPRREGVLSFA